MIYCSIEFVFYILFTCETESMFVTSLSSVLCRRRRIVLHLSVSLSRLAGLPEVYCSPPVSPPVQTCRQRCIVLHLSVSLSRLAGLPEVYCSPPVSPPGQTCRRRRIVLHLSVSLSRLAGLPEVYCSPPVSQSIQTCRRRCIVLDLSVHQARLAGGGVLFSTCQSVYPDLQAEVYCSPPVSPPVQTCRQRCIVLDLSVHQARLAGGGVLFSTCQSVSQSVRLFVRSSIIKLVNTMFHKRMNLFWCKLAQMVHIEGHEKINFGVRRSKVKVKIQKFILSR